MSTYFLFGTYTRDAIKGIAAKRTQRAEELIAGFGGKLRSVYALLGEYDIVIIADLPSNQEAMQASVEISKDTGVTFKTCPAVPVADFDNLFG